MSQHTTKTYNKTCVTCKGSDQPVLPPCMARVFLYPSLDSLEEAYTVNKDSANAEADLSLYLSLLVGFVTDWFIWLWRLS